MRLAEHRKEIEEIDDEIIRLIDRRIDISKLIFEAKREAGLPICDPERERLVQRKAMSMAEELDLDKEAVSEIFGILIRMSLQKQHELNDGIRG
ncbi:MAG TPA: chorismate mutase [Methanothrix sp.]|nr:chorismate mutase [Methanothrix sp.]